MTSYGEKTVNKMLQAEENEASSVAALSDQEDLVLKTFRLLIADLCQQFSGGHPGGAIGMAAIGVSLWKYVMRYAPHTPDYFNRDRFVLSNGHTCLFQYTFLHLTGYKAMTLDQLKSYHSSRVDSLCPGHPEIEHEGIEVTTGPLGQGIANAVGLAMATKSLAAHYNKPGHELINNHTWCMTGDACLQEGVGLEAISLAGHWRLNNLTLIYDNNQITCDGSVDLCNTEDVNAKMRACGWDVIDIMDGCFDIRGIVTALETSRESTTKPTFINVRTIIGLGSAVAGNATAHGVAFGVADVAAMKKAYSFDPEEHFVIGETVRKFFSECVPRGEKLASEWTSKLESYKKECPDLGAEFEARMNGELPTDWESLIPKPGDFPSKPTATRASNGLVFNLLAAKIKNFMVGTADLSPSVYMTYPDKEDFQHPDLRTACQISGSYTGRYIHYGVREHAMASISVGLAAYSPHCFIPVTSSFFMFYIYAAPGVRMGALQQLQIIHVATHDSIGTGEDGPTHQPIELAALYRAMPNLLYIRPADSEEVAGAWIAALNARSSSSIISTSRQPLPQQTTTRREGVLKGAYVLEEVVEASDVQGPAADVTLIGVGAELTFALQTAALLRQSTPPLRVRVVSFPCQRLFDAQPLHYRRSVLKRHLDIPAVVFEAYAHNGWERYADAGFGVARFGKSLPCGSVYGYFGFEAEGMAGRVRGFLARWGRGEVGRGEFEEL